MYGCMDVLFVVCLRQGLMWSRCYEVFTREDCSDLGLSQQKALHQMAFSSTFLTHKNRRLPWTVRFLYMPFSQLSQTNTGVTALFFRTWPLIIPDGILRKLGYRISVILVSSILIPLEWGLYFLSTVFNFFFQDSVSRYIALAVL